MILEYIAGIVSVIAWPAVIIIAMLILRPKK